MVEVFGEQSSPGRCGGGVACAPATAWAFGVFVPAGSPARTRRCRNCPGRAMYCDYWLYSRGAAPQLGRGPVKQAKLVEERKLR